MLAFEDALSQLVQVGRDHRSNDIECINVNESHGRVLAEDCIATIDVPPADNSAMDGYALWLETDEPNYPVRLPLSGRIAAGSTAGVLTQGSAVRIFTGAEIPQNANCVVIQENCTLSEDKQYLVILDGLKTGGNIRRRGQDISKDNVAIPAGTRIDAAAIGLLHSLGITDIKVYRKLKVSIFSTGDELVPAGQTLGSGQIYDSNRAMIAAQLADLPVELRYSNHLPDNLESIQRAIAEASHESDLIISSGGVSVGEEDHVKTAVSAIGTLDFWKVHMKPGKPLAYGRIAVANKNTPCHFLGLPGNPVSTFITFHLFGKALIKSLSGASRVTPTPYFQPSNFSIKKATRRPEFIRVKYSETGLDRYANQSSGVLSSMVWADALALIPSDTEINPGDLLRVFPL
jgi:molybdopterin molybdotransferase